MKLMIRMADHAYLGREQEYVLDVLQRRQLSMGKYVSRFEELVAEMAGTTFAVAVSSGTAALHTALLALGVKPGDEVIVPATSYIATANAVRYCGATPVFVDVEPSSWTLDPQQAYAACGPKTVGCIVVDLYGVTSALPFQTRDVWELEDACEAHGLEVRANAGVFSFYGNKIAACGEGGAVVTDDPKLDAKVRLLRGQGTTGRQRYVHEALGYNYRLTDLQAAVGCGQLETLSEHLRRRRQVRSWYDDRLQNMAVGRQARSVASVDWVMPITVPNRDAVAQRLEALGVETRPVFPALHRQPQYMTGQRLPVAEHLAAEGLLLPLHALMTEADVETVCAVLRVAQARACEGSWPAADDYACALGEGRFKPRTIAGWKREGNC